MSFSFELLSTSGGARRGALATPHGVVQTPIFMPVGTAGSVKALAPDDLAAAGTQILLGNTYHLMLRPGADRVRELGGLHAFMAWNGPILTDSGGFQVFSLSQGRGDASALATIDDDGVTFKSHLDGARHRMTPEESMRVQMALGADVIMAFDECPPGQAPRDVVQRAMRRTTRWLARCVAAMKRAEDGASLQERVARDQSRLFGIVQGGIHEDLRREHAAEITSTDLFGYAVGGLSVGEEKDAMWSALSATTAVLPAHKPRYLMGVGTPDDLLDGIARGVDMFDCVMPTRNARNATLFTRHGKLHVKGAKFAADTRPVDESCACYTCRTFSRAYLRHLWNAGELLFYRLASLHNVAYYLSLMQGARDAIERGAFDEYARARKAAHASGQLIE